MCSRPFGYDPLVNAVFIVICSAVKMPTFLHPRSHDDRSVPERRSPECVLPHLMECLDIDKVPAVQFMRDGRVRLICQDPEACNDVLRAGLDFDGLPVRLTPAHNRLRTAYLRNLPAEFDYDVVSFLFSEYGEVL